MVVLYNFKNMLRNFSNFCSASLELQRERPLLALAGLKVDFDGAAYLKLHRNILYD